MKKFFDNLGKVVFSATCIIILVALIEFIILALFQFVKSMFQ